MDNKYHARKAVAIVITAVLSLLFLFVGGNKLAGNPNLVQLFALWGYPIWFMYTIGAIEFMSGILLWIPRASFVGMGLILCDMLGAIATHVSHSEFSMAWVPAIVLVLNVILMRLSKSLLLEDELVSGRTRDSERIVR